MLKYLAGAAAAVLALWPMTASAAPAWEQWQHVKGAVDVDGPRSDGTMVVMASDSLMLLDVAGNLTPFATGPGGYHDVYTGEPYLAVAHGGAVAAAGCSFTPDDTFILRLRVPLGVTRVSPDGADSGSFANLSGATTLDGIAFDDTGKFDHRLLVTGPNGAKTVIFALACDGTAGVISKSAPTFEGGIAVAPATFGGFAGDLIGADENSGRIYAIGPDGKASVVVRPGLPAGGDIGVESVGFVPQGFIGRGGFVYYSDRLSAGSPHPGTDSILRLSSSDLGAAGVQDGDLLAATEGGARLVAVRCAATCTVIPVVTTATKAHGEGHLAFSTNAPPVTRSPSPAAVTKKSEPPVQPFLVDFIGTWGIPLAVAVVLLAVGAGFGVRTLRRR